MIVAVLGGMGLQGRAALLDLTRSQGVEKVLCADVVQSGDLGKLERFIDRNKIEMVPMDGSSKRDIVRVLKKGADVAIDLLPIQFMPLAFEAAIEARVPLVSTNYAHTMRHLHEPALAAGIGLMPECGLDPGIDLVICGQAAREFDEIHVINSYCGGSQRRHAGLHRSARHYEDGAGSRPVCASVAGLVIAHTPPQTARVPFRRAH